MKKTLVYAATAALAVFLIAATPGIVRLATYETDPKIVQANIEYEKSSKEFSQFVKNLEHWCKTNAWCMSDEDFNQF